MHTHTHAHQVVKILSADKLGVVEFPFQPLTLARDIVSQAYQRLDVKREG